MNSPGWIKGKVESFEDDAKKHEIHFDDGDVVSMNLTLPRKQWQISGFSATWRGEHVVNQRGVTG